MVDLAILQSVSYVAAALGVVLAAINYVITSRREEKRSQQTLETRQAQMFMNIYDRSQTKEFTNAYIKVIKTRWSTFQEYKALYNDPEFLEAENIVGNFYEGLGVLVREGLLSVRLVALLMCGMTRLYWERHMGMVEEGRVSLGYKRWRSEAEYLYVELIK